ncbi:MAG: hypothetical protein JXR37_16620 [Kiritimatiellae bacterium]|nr:hypothetical protein [Kiritimatiellia bacterium]
MSKARTAQLAAVLGGASCAAVMLWLANGRTPERKEKGPALAPPVRPPVVASRPRAARERAALPADAVPAAHDPARPARDLTADPGAARRWAADTAVPLATRQAAVAALARRGDEPAFEAVLSVADAGVYVSYTAVEALGETREPALARRARQYLAARLAHEDAQFARASIAGYARLLGRDATAGLVQALAANRTRADGYEAQVCLDIVNWLAANPDEAATAALAAELERPGRGVWSLDYGRAVVKALAGIGGHAAREAAGRYVKRLLSEMPADPLARREYLAGVREARAAFMENTP